MEQASAIVLSYNRLDNLSAIVANLRTQFWIDDIAVWHQGEPVYPPPITYVRWINCSVNYLRYGRFRAMDRAKHDTVFVQDDDAVSRNIDQLWTTWLNDPTRITTLLHSGHFRSDNRRHWGPCHEVLLGWGAIVDRRWRNMFDLWTKKYGQSELFYRKADRIFSILQQTHHTVLHADATNLPGSSSGDAAWKQLDHDAATLKARDKCLNGILKLGIPRREFVRR